MLKKTILGLAVSVLLLLCLPKYTSALTAVNSTGVKKTDPPLIVTSYSFAGSRVNFIQIFNSSGTVQNLADWTLSYGVQDSAHNEQVLPLNVPLSGLIEPNKYIVMADQALGLASPFEFIYNAPAEIDDFTVKSITLSPPADSNFLSSIVTAPAKTAANTCGADLASSLVSVRRNISTTTGNYLSTFCYYDLATSDELFMDSLYQVPEQTSIQISEILPNSRQCSPTNVDLTCFDYVKFYNPTTQTINLDDFRLRNGYAGQVSSASNTTNLNGAVEPGHYAVISTDITNSASWLWLEDRYGIKHYDNTVISYPSAGESKRGVAYAYNSDSDIWQWTDTPSPFDSASVFASDKAGLTTSVASVLSPCPSGKFRNPATNRCKNILTISSDTAPCQAGQFRNPATNRCKKIATSTSTSSLTPCKVGQVRNPATNRCKSVATTTSSLTPCKDGYERNPETNRCRKVTSSSTQFGNFDKPASTASKLNPQVLFFVATFAIGYALYEYRDEARRGMSKLKKAIYNSLHIS